MTTDKNLINNKPDEIHQEHWGNSDTDNKKPVVERDYNAKKDSFIYRVAAITLAFSAIAGILAGIILPIYGTTVPDQIWMLSSGAIGAFAVLLKIDR